MFLLMCVYDNARVNLKINTSLIKHKVFLNYKYYLFTNHKIVYVVFPNCKRI